MGLRVVDRAEVEEAALLDLGLDPEQYDLDSSEVLSALVRRTAAFVCPCTPRALSAAARQSLEGLVALDDESAERVENVVESLVSYGDLLELRGTEYGSSTLLYTAPPSFVQRVSGAALLVGVEQDDDSVLTAELLERIHYRGYMRSLPAAGEDAVADELESLGIHRLSHDEWLQLPGEQPPEEYVHDVQERLNEAGPSGEIVGLRILDPAESPLYYRGRWQEPRDRTGCFVARRPQAFGPELWCYAELKAGQAVRLVDLPLEPSANRGCDEAWHLQAALDILGGNPQRYRTRLDEDGRSVVDFFSPCPKWARRRWDFMGSPMKTRGSLFSYCFEQEEIGEEVEFARRRLWMEEIGKEGTGKA